jgi:hypothetical protein
MGSMFVATGGRVERVPRWVISGGVRMLRGKLVGGGGKDSRRRALFSK